MKDFELVSKVLSGMVNVAKCIHDSRIADITLECNGVDYGENIIKVTNNGKCEASDVRVMVTNITKDEMYWDNSPYESRNILNISHINPGSQQQRTLLCWKIVNDGHIEAEVEIRWKDKRKEEQSKIITIAIA